MYEGRFQCHQGTITLIPYAKAEELYGHEKLNNICDDYSWEVLLFVGGLFSKTALDSAIEKETGIIIVETKMTSDCPRVYPSNTVYVFEWEDSLMDYMSNYFGMQEDIL